MNRKLIFKVEKEIDLTEDLLSLNSNWKSCRKWSSFFFKVKKSTNFYHGAVPLETILLKNCLALFRKIENIQKIKTTTTTTTWTATTRVHYLWFNCHPLYFRRLRVFTSVCLRCYAREKNTETFNNKPPIPMASGKTSTLFYLLNTPVGTPGRTPSCHWSVLVLRLRRWDKPYWDPPGGNACCPDLCTSRLDALSEHAVLDSREVRTTRIC